MTAAQSGHTVNSSGPSGLECGPIPRRVDLPRVAVDGPALSSHARATEATPWLPLHGWRLWVAYVLLASVVPVLWAADYHTNARRVSVQESP